MCGLIFHEQFPIVVQWDSQASIYSGDTMNDYKHVIQITFDL